MVECIMFIVIYLTSVAAGPASEHVFQTDFTYHYVQPKECKDGNGNQGDCVKINDCPKTEALQRGGLTDSTIKYLKKVNCGYTGQTPLICCERPNQKEPNEENKKLAASVLNPEKEFWPTHRECAFTGDNFRVTGGRITDFGEYRFVALLHKPNRFYCGGSLINHWYVLTAAHCLSDKPDSVRLGEWKISSEKDCDPQEEDTCSDPVRDIKVESMIVHENYDPVTFENDIGLLRLQERVEYTEWIKPVCLPRSREEEKKSAIGHKVFIMGWGRTNASSSHQSDVLVKAEIEIQKQGHCAKKLEINLEKSQFCAGSNDDRNSCTGDSGGPAVVKTGLKSYYLQLGIISAGNRFCGMEDTPAVYSNVAELMDWIDEKVDFRQPETNEVRDYEGKWPTTMQCKKVIDIYRITNGQNAGLGEFPFMAILRRRKRKGIELDCGASLINNQYVLTAAHCTTGLLEVRLGEWNLKTEKDCDEQNRCSDPFKQIKAEEIIVHPKYKRGVFENDIALVRLAERVEYTRWISPICLPRLDTEKNIVNGSVTTMGWGYIDGARTKKPDILLNTQLNIFDRNVCNTKLERTFVDSQLCAGSLLGNDTCAGDSGGPLVLESKTLPFYNTLVGIVSLGPAECGILGNPAIYTNVAKYLDWIEDNVTL